MNQPEVPFKKILFYWGLMLITGSINTSANKLLQNSESLNIPYVHQKFITFTMFLGEMLCLIVHCVSKKCKKKNEPLIQVPETSEPIVDRTSEQISIDNIENKEEETKKEEPTKNEKQAKLWYFGIPAFADLLASTIMSLALTFLPSSVNEMLRGCVILFTAIASFIFLKTKYYRHHVLGICIVICGLAVVGVNALMKQGEKEGFSSSILIGIILMLVSQIFSATMYLFEEKFVKNLKAEPLFVVGMEGFWGAVFYIILLIPFHFIRCDSWKKDFQKMCQPISETTDLIQKFRFEDSILALRQIFSSGKIGGLTILYIVSIGSFNFGGVSVTKYASATSRTIINTLRTILIWIFFLTPAVPEKVREKWSFVQLAGFILLIIGTILYNEIVEIPCGGFNTNTKRAIKEREKLKAEEEEKKETEEKEENDDAPDIKED